MKKIVNWVVEKYMFEEYEQELVDMIKSKGHNCLLFDDTDHVKFDFDRSIKNKFDKDDCVIFYGSLQRGRQMWSQTNFIPGVFLSINNYECYKYYGYYGDNLVNSNYIMLGLNDVKRRYENIFENLYSSHWSHLTKSKIFIRPSNGYKTFTGQLLPWENFDKEFDILCGSYGGLDMNQLVLIAPEKKVREENRFVVIKKGESNQIVDGNKYMIDGKLINERIVDDKAWKYAETIMNNYTPDSAFTIDIAKLDDGSYKILEIGSFCCAGLYNMDIEKVVDSISNLCLEQYKEYYEMI